MIEHHVLVARLETAVARQRHQIEKDNEYWEDLATGQDTQEAEGSGLMEGMASAYEAVLRLVQGLEDADLPTIEGNEIEPEPDHPFSAAVAILRDAATTCRQDSDDEDKARRYDAAADFLSELT